MTTVRALITTTVKKGWSISQLDVNNAFLHGNLNEEVYMQVPPGLVIDKPGLVCKLNKSLYGLKQASRQWYAKLTEALCSRGYTHSMYDYSLFYKRNENTSIYVAIYIDDVLLTGTDQQEIAQLKSFLYEQFKIKDLGQLHYFLGLKIMYKDDVAIISQRKFELDLLKEYNCLEHKACSSPLDPTIKLKAKEETILQDPTYYRKLVGKLNFLTNTVLDIAYSVQHLSQFMQEPREPHLKAAFHLLRYLKNDPTLGIFMSKDGDHTVKAYYDSDWAACPDSMRSITGYLSALHIARNPVFHERTKHIEVDCHFVRDQLQAGLISLHHIRTDNQLADILTKALTGIKHSATLGKLVVFTTPPT
uniref:Uncharacterized mitochondrial protein AtMg00810-like n=1 Tax=Nicotiana tabacum TaxID=4097 RepID=A0A1S4DKT6_TOBAC|nr:PREDICTED: uncharacterized mitochondrial protein AtMg00810-like [Nicotiana tabacum]